MLHFPLLVLNLDSSVKGGYTTANEADGGDMDIVRLRGQIQVSQRTSKCFTNIDNRLDIHLHINIII